MFTGGRSLGMETLPLHSRHDIVTTSVIRLYDVMTSCLYYVHMFLEFCYQYLGLLTIDGELIGQNSKSGSTSVNSINVLYAGGFPKDAKQISVVPVCDLSY